MDEIMIDDSLLGQTLAALALRQHYEDRVRGIGGISYKTSALLLAYNNVSRRQENKLREIAIKAAFIEQAKTRMKLIRLEFDERQASDQIDENYKKELLGELQYLMLQAEKYAADLESYNA